MRGRDQTLRYAIGLAIGLLATMVVIRAGIWRGSATSAYFALSLRRFAAEDTIAWAWICGPLLAAVALARGKWRRRVLWLGVVVSIIAVILVGINPTAVYWLRGPLTFQWLVYADMLKSDTPRIALQSVVDGAAIGWLALAVVSFVVVVALAIGGLALAGRRGVEMPVRAVLGIGAVLLVWSATRFPDPGLYSSGQLASPVSELARTAWTSLHDPLDLDAPAADAREFRLGAAGAGTHPRPAKLPDILVFVLESTGVRDMVAAGDLPNIARLAAQGTSFSRAYVPIATSTRSNFVLPTSRYPLFSYRMETQWLRGRPLVSLAARLQAAGYETTYMKGGDLAFTGVGAFLADKGFNHLVDMFSIPCKATAHVSTVRWQHMDYIADSCLVDDYLAREAQPRRRPRFTVVWTTSAHFPYAPQKSSPSQPRARYLAALRESDEQVGRVMDRLRAAGRGDDTLIVLLGDHGEAFFEHQNFSHGSTIFEEETHIPMIVSWPGHVGQGAGDDRLASLVDVAPTVLGLVGLPAEPSWQGLDLFGQARRSRVYMFAIQRGFVIGYVEGVSKYVLDIDRGTAVRFDLARDPQERVPIPLGPAEAALARARVSGWAGYNARLYRQ